jgi:hypothetical protein
MAARLGVGRTPPEIQRIDDHAEGMPALEGMTLSPVQHHADLPRLVGQSPYQARLADSGFAFDQEHRGCPVRDAAHQLANQGELTFPTDQHLRSWLRHRANAAVLSTCAAWSGGDCRPGQPRASLCPTSVPTIGSRSVPLGPARFQVADAASTDRVRAGLDPGQLHQSGHPVAADRLAVCVDKLGSHPPISIGAPRVLIGQLDLLGQHLVGERSG